MEAGNDATMAYALGHDRGAEILLKSVQRLTHKEAENHIGTAVVKVEDIASPEDAQLIENREVCESSVGPSIPSNKFPMYFEEPPSATEILSTLSALELETDMQPYNDTGISGVPTYPTIPKLQPSDVTDTIHQADGLTIPRSKPSLGSSHNKLPTVIESKPSNHQLTGISFEEAVPTISITETDRLVASNNAITSTSNMLLHLPSSRTSTMCSAVSAKSHQEPGPIHINPSAQLQSMQSISELDSRLTEVSNLRKPWGKPRYDRISGQGTYTTTGTPESISKVPLSAGLFEAHSRLNDNLLSQYVDEVAKYDWARSSEWVEPCAVDDGPKEWIEDYLTRQEQADRDEESERQRQEKQDKRYRGIRSRVNSTDKFRRKLSKKRVTKEWGSFEARQERKNAMVFDLDAGSSPRRRTSIPIPGEDLEKPERARAFSWSPDTPQDLISENALLNQSSWAPKPSTLKSSSQAHFTNPSDTLQISLPSQHPSRRTFSHSSFPPNHHRSTSALRRVAIGHHSHTHFRTSSWEKLKVKRVTSIGSNVKRTISTDFSPVITEGKDSVKGLVERVEKVGDNVSRKLSASWKGKWKGLGKKKSMNVRGVHSIERSP